MREIWKPEAFFMTLMETMELQYCQMHKVPHPSPTCSASTDYLPLRQLMEQECGSERAIDTVKQELKSKITFTDNRMRSIMSFYLCYLLCLSLGIGCVLCVTYWSAKWLGGFAWDSSNLQFNWHPVLMVSGLVVLYGNGAVLYRVPLTWGQNKLPWKLLHAGIMMLALVLSVLGLYAVFDNHNAKHIPNLYSLHSWIGICTTALFATQWVVGIAGFLLPCSPVTFRRLLKPVHVWMGGSILVLSIVSCISGINEKLFFALKGNTTKAYSQLPSEALLGNSLGVLIVAFALVVLKLLSNHKWQRPEPTSDEVAYRPLPQEDG